MNPNIYWWNPVIHFPFSGAVTQEIDVLSQELREKNKAADQFIALLAEIAQGMTMPADKRKSGSRLPQATGPGETTTLRSMLIDSESHERRIQLTQSLLGVLKSLDNSAFERAVIGVNSDKQG